MTAGAADPNAELMNILVLGLVGIGIVVVIGLLWITLASVRDRMRERRRAAEVRKELAEQEAYRAKRMGAGATPTWTSDFNENAPIGTLGAEDEPPPPDPAA